MAILDMIFVGGVVLAFSVLIAVLAWGVHQTKNLSVLGAVRVDDKTALTPVSEPESKFTPSSNS